MKRLLRVFVLTVAEQRVVVAILLAWFLWVAYHTHQADRSRRGQAEIVQPSPSPGILP